MKMRSISWAGALLLTMIFVLDSSANPTRTGSCCTQYTRPSLIQKQSLNCIQGYRKQNNRGVCKIDAVILHTACGRSLCLNPRLKAVRKTLKALRDRWVMKKPKLNTERMKKCCV
ncbi:hypothetical protein GJAV_G00083650 [Gymnothorax javanicus]|nr:hypothetical protein GJAV_G00083650 [Gymnothorax javanicus]